MLMKIVQKQVCEHGVLLEMTRRKLATWNGRLTLTARGSTLDVQSRSSHRVQLFLIAIDP